MGRLLLVRHGQASLFAADYDTLSPLGVEQSRLLGTYWAERGVRFDRVYVGPRVRHRQTHDAVAAVYRGAGIEWPAAHDAPALDEHDGPRVVEEVLRTAAAETAAVSGVELAAALVGAPVVEAAAATAATAAELDERRRLYLREFTRVTRQWARGEVEAPGIESFGDFRARVEGGVRAMCAGGRGTRAGAGDETVVAFTSGGPVAAAAGLALDLANVKTLELSWAVSNSSVSEFLYSGDRFSLSVFNAAPHVSAEQSSMV